MMHPLCLPSKEKKKLDKSTSSMGRNKLRTISMGDVNRREMKGNTNERS